MRSLASGWPLHVIAGSLGKWSNGESLARSKSNGVGSQSKIVVGEFVKAFQLFFRILWSIAKSVWADFSHTCSFHHQEDSCVVSFVAWSFLRPSNAVSCVRVWRNGFLDLVVHCEVCLSWFFTHLFFSLLGRFLRS